MNAPEVSVVILTLNEERDLPKCLLSLSRFEDIHVLDSGSTDRTEEIAREHGARLSMRPFDSFGQQRNYALDELPLQNEWVLFLDADECATPAFVLAVQRAVAGAEKGVAGFYCCWKLILDGRWLKRADGFPRWQFRLLHRDRARFTDFGHGQVEGERTGRIEYLNEPYEHYAFSKGWSFWVERHNRYSTLEARERRARSASLGDVFRAKGADKPKKFKLWLGQSLLFPVFRFFYGYVFKGGCLEGRAGFKYCASISIYEFFIWLKLDEQDTRDLPIGESETP